MATKETAGGKWGKFPTESERIFWFGETFCVCSGDFIGQPFRFAPWQKKVIRRVYDTIGADGYRAVREPFIMVPRKTGKTELMAVLALYHLVFERGKEIYGCASARAQAGVLFQRAKDMVLSNKFLKSIITIRRFQLRNDKNNNIYEALSSDSDRAQGKNPAIVFMDELHAIKDGGKLYYAMKQGMAARKDPLLFSITTAGDDKRTHCYDLYKVARAVIRGEKEAPAGFLPIIYSLDENEPWEEEGHPATDTEPATGWYKVNPSIGYTTTVEAYRKLCDEAKLSPRAQVAFRNYNLNQWIDGDVSWLAPSSWELCYDPNFTLDDFVGCECVCGLDLATKRDLPAFAAVFKREDKYYLYTKFWICANSYDHRVKNEHIGFIEWVEKGHVIISGTSGVEYGDIRGYINDFHAKYPIKEINVDPNYKAFELCTNLAADGLNVVEHRQNAVSMNGPFSILETYVLDKKLHHDGNGCMFWNFGNVKVDVVDRNGNRMPSKKRSKDRIDGIVATAMAIGRCVLTPSDDLFGGVADTTFTEEPLLIKW